LAYFFVSVKIKPHSSGISCPFGEEDLRLLRLCRSQRRSLSRTGVQHASVQSTSTTEGEGSSPTSSSVLI
jgi:hypothetical protein